MGQREAVKRASKSSAAAREEMRKAAITRAASLNRRKIPKHLKEADSEYWASVTPEERIGIMWEIVRERSRLKGIDPDTLRLDKTKARVSRNVLVERIRRRRKPKKIIR